MQACFSLSLSQGECTFFIWLSAGRVHLFRGIPLLAANFFRFRGSSTVALCFYALFSWECLFNFLLWTHLSDACSFCRLFLWRSFLLWGCALPDILFQRFLAQYFCLHFNKRYPWDNFRQLWHWEAIWQPSQQQERWRWQLWWILRWLRGFLRSGFERDWLRLSFFI